MHLPEQLRGDWAITPQALRAMTDERSLALMARPGDPMPGANCVETRADLPGVAIIHVKGPLVRYASWWGGTSYGQLLKDLQRCLDDASITAIAWNFDSPGGEVNSCAECSDAIFAARGKKPMKAYASYLCASGALWLASAAGDIECAATALVGSVGVIAYLYDDSKMMQDIGIKELEIVASQSPNKSQLPANADYRARVQQRLDDTCEVFISALARNYSVSPGYVQKNFGQGDVFVGAKAVEARLATGINNFESVLAGLAKPKTTQIFQSTGARQMDVKTMARLLKLDESASERQIEDRAQSLSQLERGLLAAVGATDHDTALGKVSAAMTAVAERDTARAELKAERNHAEKKAFKDQLKSGYDSTRIVLGQLPKIATLCLSDANAAKAVAAMAQVQAPSDPDSKEDKKSYKKALFSAMCSVDITAEENRRLQGYLSLQTAQLPQAIGEPPDDKKNREKVQAVSEADALAAGIPIERARQLAAIKSASDLPLPGAAEKKES